MRTLQSEIVRNGLLQACTAEIDQKSTKVKVKPKERLSDRDWAELMGINKSTYKKVKGRVKQR